MKKFLTMSALALALQPLASLAVPVTLQSTWKNPGGLYTGTGVFTFTFEDATAMDAVLTPPAQSTLAYYTNAISAATFTFDNTTFTLDTTKDNRIMVHAGMYISGSDAQISAQMRDTNNVEYDLRLSFEDYVHTLADVSLSNLNGLFANENYAYLRPVSETTIFGKYSLEQKTALAPVPVPAAAWLFGTSMLGLTGLAKRKKA